MMNPLANVTSFSLLDVRRYASKNPVRVSFYAATVIAQCYFAYILSSKIFGFSNKPRISQRKPYQSDSVPTGQEPANTVFATLERAVEKSTNLPRQLDFGKWGASPTNAESRRPIQKLMLAKRIALKFSNKAVAGIGTPYVHYTWKGAVTREEKEQLQKQMELASKGDKSAISVSEYANAITAIEKMTSGPELATQVARELGVDCSPRLDLNAGISPSKYLEALSEVQEGILSGNGIDSMKTREYAEALAGVTLSARLPVNLEILSISSEKTSVDMHAIFLSGLNLKSADAGSFYIGQPSTQELTPLLLTFAQKTVEASIQAALHNKSDVLIFDPKIGAGEIADDYSIDVAVNNTSALISAKNSNAFDELKVIAIDDQLDEECKKALKRADIEVVSSSKHAFAALCASEGLKVSLMVEVDPMVLYGVHGPGGVFWSKWQGSLQKKDEWIFACVSPSYMLHWLPTEIYPNPESQATWVGPLSQA